MNILEMVIRELQQEIAANRCLASINEETIVLLEQPSERRALAERLASRIRNLGLTDPYGGEVTEVQNKKWHKYYEVTFSHPRTLGGVIRVLGVNKMYIHTNRGDWDCFSESEAIAAIENL